MHWHPTGDQGLWYVGYGLQVVKVSATCEGQLSRASYGTRPMGLYAEGMT